jgi:hypothetical protein
MNTRHIWMGAAALAVAFSGGVAAQSDSAAANSRQQSKTAITVTGCLQSADQPTSVGAAPGAAPGAAAGAASTSKPSSSKADKFVLANAAQGGGASATKGDSPAAGAGGSSYTLEGKTAELRPHLNHQVQITGRPSPSSSSSGAAGGSQQLQVESVKMISANCS